MEAWYTCYDLRRIVSLAKTMRAAFSNVYIIDTPGFDSSLVICTNARTSLNNFFANTAKLTNPLLKRIAYTSIAYGHIREEKTSNVYFTDDRAPVEQLIDQIIFEAVQKGEK